MSNSFSGAATGKRLKYALAILAGAAGSILLAGAASAANPAETAPSVVVHYDNAMLASDSGVRELYRRLNTAAQKVCVDSGIGRFVSDATLACRRQAVERAVQQIDNPHLAALQASRVKSS